MESLLMGPGTGGAHRKGGFGFNYFEPIKTGGVLWQGCVMFWVSLVWR